jgi:hypothetical protein
MMTFASLDILARIFFGLSVTYLVATISEVVWHRHVYHASSRTRRFWARYPRYFDYFLRHHYRHTIVHHGLTFREDHITQFKDLEAKAEIDRIVAPKNDKLIHRDGYGLYSSISTGLSGLITFNITVAPVLPILYWIAGPWVLVGGVPILILSPMLTMLIHPFLHQHHEKPAPNPSIFFKVLMRTWYFKRLWRHHFVHHKFPNSNFNLLLGGDHLLGTYRRPDEKDLIDMEAFGIPFERANII